jgi:hypothetical protein
LAGTTVKCHLFTLRLSYSGKAVHRVFASEAQEAFLEGHVEAFRVLGGVPTRHIRYDNLKPAVNQVCTGRSRVESERWVAFRSHYGFDAFYCIPGQKGAHEKGGVEQEGGRFRRTHLVPVPDVASLAELNERIAEIDAAEDERILHGRLTSVGFNYRSEADELAPLPGEDFECGLTLTPKVDRSSRITVRRCHYSVPARFIGRTVRVLLRGNELLVFDRHKVVATHPRLTKRYDYRDELDHYLEILQAKPGALAGSTALAAARADGSFTAVHEAFWASARQTHGDAAGTRGPPAVPQDARRCRPGRHDRRDPGRIDQHRRGGHRSPKSRGRHPGPGRARRRRRGRTPALGRTGRPDHDPHRPQTPTAGRQPPAAVGGRLRPTAEPPPTERSRTSTPTSVTGQRLPAQRPDASAQGAVETVIDEACRILHLPTIRSRFEDLAENALRERATYKDFLADLLEAECAHREERKKIRLVREAGSNDWRTSTTPPTRTSPLSRSTPSLTRPGSPPASRSA